MITGIVNAFGGAKTFQGNVFLATQTGGTFKLGLREPLEAIVLTHGEQSMYRFDRDNRAWASLKESSKVRLFYPIQPIHALCSSG